MIPDLLYQKEIQYYIFQKTGVTLTKQQITQLMKSGEIESFKTPQNRWATTKRAIDEFIREHTRKETEYNTKQKYKVLLACYQKLRNNKKPNPDSLEQ